LNLEQAIKTALEYEGKVYKTYLDATEQSTSGVGKRVFGALAEEEKGHIQYLRERLEEWQKDGRITVAKLGTVVPSKKALDEGVEKLRAKVGGNPSGTHDAELELLQKALQVEVETGNFYKQMVRALDADGQKMFARFVEIEEGHQAIVQAEIDCVSGMGFWFDSREFSLEM